jgi:glycogen operon protein
VAVYLNGQGIPDLDTRGQRVTDDSFLLWFNAHHEPIDFALPGDEFGKSWVPVIYTAAESDDENESHDAGGKVTVAARSVMVLRATE